MWGCILAAAITFPLVWGWIHFETVPGELEMYRTYLFGFGVSELPVDSLAGFLIFRGLVWASFLVIGGVMLAFRRRMIDHGAAAVQRFAEDVLPIALLLAISVTGLMPRERACSAASSTRSSSGQRWSHWGTTNDGTVVAIRAGSAARLAPLTHASLPSRTSTTR